MIQRGEDVRFAHQPCAAVGIGSERLGKDLQRDIAPQLLVVCTIDLAHAAHPDERTDRVRAKARSRRDRHLTRDYSGRPLLHDRVLGQDLLQPIRVNRFDIEQLHCQRAQGVALSLHDLSRGFVPEHDERVDLVVHAGPRPR
jgi:hypothetical protein